MAQIVLIHSNQNVRDLISINLTSYLGAHIIPRNTAEEAVALLEILPNIDLVITENKIGDENSAEKLILYCLKKDMDTGIVVMGGDAKKIIKNGLSLTNPLDWEGAVDAASKILGMTLEELKKKISPEYVPISSEYFHVLNSSPCDVFIRIKQGTAQFQHLKRIHRNDTFELKEIERYESQGLKYFYILKDDRDAFTTFLSNALVTKLEGQILQAHASVDIATVMPLLGRSYDLAQKSILEQGLNQSTIYLADTVIQSMLSTTERSKVLGPIFRQIIGLSAGKIFKKGQIALMVGLEILKLKNTELGIDNKEETRQKLAYAAFFSDLALLEIKDPELLDRLVMLDSGDMIKEENLDDVTLGKLMNHALEGAVFIRKNTEAPLDVDLIVKQHHGSLNGSGFKTEYQQLSPLSRLFILAEAFARQFIKYTVDGSSKRPIILDMQEKFKDHKSMEPFVQKLQEALKIRESHGKTSL